MFRNWDGILLEPLKFSEGDRNFLNKLRKEFPEDILLLNELKGRGGKISFQWIRIEVSLSGIRSFLKIIDHFGDYIAIYKINHKIFSELPESFLQLKSFHKIISENEFLNKLEEKYKNE